jgi:uncharacterized membrane protein YhaH (DUF805 family)
MNFKQAIQNGFQNYANLKGSATRREYWLWMMFVALVSFVCGVVANIGFGLAPLIWDVIIVTPSFAFLNRRLRDAGLSTKLAFVPLTGFVVAVVYSLVGSAIAAQALVGSYGGGIASLRHAVGTLYVVTGCTIFIVLVCLGLKIYWTTRPSKSLPGASQGKSTSSPGAFTINMGA